MNPYEMMFRSGVMSEWRPTRRWQERRMMNEALKGVMPKDHTWQVALLVAGIVIGNIVLFVRYFV